MEARVEAKVAPEHEVSSRGLIASVISDAQKLIALEVALAKQELKELATGNAIAVAVMAFGGLLVALAVLSRSLCSSSCSCPGRWEAAAVWAAAYLVIGIVLVVIGKARLQVKLPPRTIESLKENKESALRRVRSNGR